MKKIKINFCDFWNGFKKTDNFFYHRLCQYYEIEICDDPDIIIFSLFGKENQKYGCKKIQYIGENIRPSFFCSDYSISFDHLKSHRNIRYPIYNLYYTIEEIPNFQDCRKKFCCVVTSNPNGNFRQFFFDKLSKIKKVDSGGRYRNNIGSPVTNKLEFLEQYRFSFAFENSCYPGYTTEKILESKKAGTIPIYWGNPRVSEDFNVKSFINVHDFKNIDECIECILEIENDDDRYRAIRNEPLYLGNRITKYSDVEYFDRWIISAIEGRKYFKNRYLSFLQKKINSINTKLYDLVPSSRK